MKMNLYSNSVESGGLPGWVFPRQAISYTRWPPSEMAGGVVRWCRLKKKIIKSLINDHIPRGVLKGLITSEKLFTLISNQ